MRGGDFLRWRLKRGWSERHAALKIGVRVAALKRLENSAKVRRPIVVICRLIDQLDEKVNEIAMLNQALGEVENACEKLKKARESATK